MVLSSGVAVEYDWLVLALGADSVFFGIEGVKEHCIPFCSYPDAMKVLSSSMLCAPATYTHFSFGGNNSRTCSQQAGVICK